MKTTLKPPPVMMGAPVISYAELGKGIRYPGHSNLFVDGREIGPVSRLAICKAADNEYLLVHCTPAWLMKGHAGYASVEEARQCADRIYPGASQRWMAMKVSKVQVERYLRKVWAGQECTLCGRRPDQVESMVTRKSAVLKKRVRVCDHCITELHTFLHER